MPQYHPETDIPDLSGRVILVTGGTAGLGAQTVLLLAAHNPSHIYFTGRSATSADHVIAEVKSKHPAVAISFIAIDLSSLLSVQECAKKFLSFSTRLDILICNAGIMAVPPGLTKDGYEIQFGTNHLGHALLINSLLPNMMETTKLPGADVRIVSLSSEGSAGHPIGGIIFKDLKTPQNNLHVLGSWQRYGQSKLANVLYAAELARKYPDCGVLFLSVHPGVFNTGLVKNLGWANKAFVWAGTGGAVKDETKNGEGAWNTCWAATSDRYAITNGGFYFPVGIKAKKMRENMNQKLAEELWIWTQKELRPWTGN